MYERVKVYRNAYVISVEKNHERFYLLPSKYACSAQYLQQTLRMF